MTNQTLLWRQVHPSWVQEGRVTSQVFQPTPKDDYRLSVYDGDRITAEAAWSHYTEQLRFASVGVLAVTCGECQQQALAVVPDPQRFPEHAVIGFAGLSRADLRRKAQHLRAAAVQRGWQHRPEPTAEPPAAE